MDCSPPCTKENQSLPSDQASVKILDAPDELEAKSDSTADGRVLRARIYLCVIYLSMFLEGWNDGTSGPLLPRMQKFYGVGFLVVSLIFVVSCVGFIVGSIFNLYLHDRLGFGRMIVLGYLLQLVAFCIQAPAPPFPLFVFSYVFNGFGLAVQNAQTNAYVASLRHNSELYMGILHAIYGAGALSSPLVATQFSQMRHWSFHYLISLGLALFNVVILCLTFQFRSQNEVLARICEAPEEPCASESTSNKFQQVLLLKSVHVLAIFTFLYVGAEVTIGGWIVTYIIDVRHGGPSSGYISSGFFGGMMIGRVSLLRLNKKIGEQKVMYFYVALALGLELVVWFVPSLIADAVTVSLIGFFLGPIYPIIMNQTGRVVPRWLLCGSIGWIAGFGHSGSAILPFITGAIASKTGIKTLQPLLVSMTATLPVLWFFVPSGKVSSVDAIQEIKIADPVDSRARSVEIEFRDSLGAPS